MIKLRHKGRPCLLAVITLTVCCKPLDMPIEPTPPPRQVQGANASGTLGGAKQSETSQADKAGDPDYSPGQGANAAAKTSSTQPNTNQSGTLTSGAQPLPSSSPSGSDTGFGSLLNTLVGFGTSAFKNLTSNSGSGTNVQKQPLPSVQAPAQNQNTAPAPAPNQNSMPPAPNVSGIPTPLQVNAPANARFQVSNYGAELQGNKARVAAAADRAGANMQEKALIIAIAMQETTFMRGNERDANKDGTQSANVSLLNMNIDMIQMLGYTRGDGGAYLNSDERLSEAASYLVKAFRTWGIERTLNFQRGGRTAFNDGTSYGAADYRNSIATIYNKIAQDQAFLSDGRRIEVNLVGV